MEDNCNIWIGDKLPTIYEVALTVFHYSKRAKTQKRTDTIYRYATSLRNTWIRSFGENFVITRQSIVRKIEGIMKDYDNRVVKSHEKAPMRILNKNWMKMDVPQPKRGPRVNLKNSSLFNVGKDLNNLEGVEKIFYDDQCNQRIHRLSQEVDIDYEDGRQALEIEQQQQEQQHLDEMDYINEDIEIVSPARPRNVAISRPVSVEKGIQVDGPLAPIPAPAIRKVRNTTYKIKDAISSVSSKAGVSTEKARVATQTVADKLYGHRFELEPPKSSNEQPQPPKKPRTAEHYKAYENVLPSAKSINMFKHKKALSQEIIAAKALISKKPCTKATLHFDTTTRSRIDGDWPSLILNFKDDDPRECRMIPLRPLFFAYEDRSQIISLIVETLKRLSVAANKLNVTEIDLWTQIDAIMTDAVRKNMKIGEGVAEILTSNHIPIHLLCKSHTCERLDNDNLTTLAVIESQIGLRDLILKREPMLKSFLRNTKSVVQAAMEALLKLVSVEGDGKTTSLGPLFNLKLEEAGVHKSFSLYKEKRFTRLGYQAGAIYDCIPFFKQVLTETPLNNLLVRSCKIYIENDFILAGLKALANFTYKITMPYLNCVEKTDQSYLVEVLPKLCQDLLDKKTDTLSDFHVEWIHVNMKNNSPVSDLDNYLLGEMCLQAAQGVELQCKGEYWADDTGEKVPRATQIHKLSPEQRKNLPTNNLCCERYLAKFGYLASQSASHSNKLFKGKRIKDDLMLLQESEETRVANSMRSVMKRLDEMELSWSGKQKGKKKERLMENLRKKMRGKDFVDLLLKKCKEHNGPVTSIEELQNLVKENSTNLKSYLRLEIQYQRETHQRDAEVRKDMYKVNRLSVEQMVENLTILFSEDPEADEAVVFPGEDEIMDILTANAEKDNATTGEIDVTQDASTLVDLEPMQPVAVVWDVRNKKKWYVGFYLDKNDDETFRIDHLERVNGRENKIWQRPSGRDDIQHADEIQILPMNVLGTWDLSTDRPSFILSNEDEINDCFMTINGLFKLNIDM